MTDLPRHDPEAEAALVGLALMKPEAIDETAWFLKPEHFFGHEHRTVWATLLALRSEGRPCDVLEVGSRLRATKQLGAVGGPVRLAELMDFPVVGKPEALATTIRNWARIRDAQHAFQRLSIEARSAAIPDPDAWIAEAQRQAIEVTTDLARDGSRGRSYGEIAAGAIGAAQSAAAGPGFQGYPTGLPALDRHTGGFAAPHVWVIAGRPGQGKTALVQQAAEATARAGGLVIFFEQEMSEDELGQRAVAREARYPLSNIRSGRIARESWSKLTEAADALGQLPIIVDDTQALTPSRIRAKIRQHLAAAERRYGPLPLRLVVVDHIQLTKGENRQSSRYEQLTENSGAMKAMAKEFRCCFAVLSQLNRPEKGQKVRPPTLVDLRETGALEQDADVVLMIHREDEYVPPAERNGHAELLLLKGRHSGSAHFTARFEGRYQLFWQDDEGENRDDEA